MAEHRMQLAKVSPQYARRHGLNSNHHARVWCTCMDNPANPPGTFAGQHRAVRNDRTAEQARNDPRRLGTYDHIGVIDLRDAGSGLRLWREHLITSTHRG